MQKFSQTSWHFDQYKWERRTIRRTITRISHSSPTGWVLSSSMQSRAPWPDCAVVTSCNTPVFTCNVSWYGKLKYCWACCWYADNPQCQTALPPTTGQGGLGCARHIWLWPQICSAWFSYSFFVALKQQIYQVMMKRSLYGDVTHKIL